MADVHNTCKKKKQQKPGDASMLAIRVQGELVGELK